MKVLNLLSSGGIGGIEVLCEDIGKYSAYENGFCFLFDKGIIYDEMKKDGQCIYDLTSANHGFSLNKLIRLSKIASEYDVVVAHHASLGLHLYFWLLSLINRNPRYVLMAHSCFDKGYYYFKSSFKTAIRKFLLERVMKCADKIIYVSEAGRESFVKEFNVDRNKTAVVYNGISEQLLMDGKSNFSCFEGKLKILYIGRLEKLKGVDLLIKAVKIVQMPVDLVIVGDGSERQNLENLVKKLNLQDSIHFMGSRRDKDGFYRSANVFAYPSTCVEVFGISIVEAMAYGIPCISNVVGGIPEIIKNGENGFLSETIDEKGIARALESVYKMYTENNAESIQKSAKATAAKFSINNTVACLQYEYESIA